jgi:hypothetical protein
VPTYRLAGLPFVAPTSAPSDDLLAATGRTTWPDVQRLDPAAGDLWLVAQGHAELGLAIIVEVTEHWAAVLPATVASGEPAAARRLVATSLLPALDVWTGHEATITTDLLTRRLGAALRASDVLQLDDAAGSTMPADVEATWSSLNLGIDLGR